MVIVGARTVVGWREVRRVAMDERHARVWGETFRGLEREASTKQTHDERLAAVRLWYANTATKRRLAKAAYRLANREAILIERRAVYNRRMNDEGYREERRSQTERRRQAIKAEAATE